MVYEIAGGGGGGSDPSLVKGVGTKRLGKGRVKIFQNITLFSPLLKRLEESHIVLESRSQAL